MATSLNQISNTLVMTNQLETIDILTDQSKLRVVLTDDGLDIYSGTLYSYEGKVTVYDLRNIVEMHLGSIGKSYAKLSLTCYDSSNTVVLAETLRCVYCNIQVHSSIEDLRNDYFLTTLKSKRTTRYTREYLSFLHGEETITVTAHCMFKTTAGEFATAAITLGVFEYKEEGTGYVSVHYDDIFNTLSSSGWSVERVMSYSIEVGNRVFSYYVHPGRATYQFVFWNCFNVPETLSVDSLTKSKTKMERELAKADGRYSIYDNKIEKEYEVETSALTASESEWIEQLFMSGRVSVIIADSTVIKSEREIVITESNCEISDGDTEMNRVKFTWRYAKAIPHSGESGANREEVYSEQYGYQYG